MEATNVNLLNKLNQDYLNNLQIGEKDDNGNFIFSGDTVYADGGGFGSAYTYTGELRGFSRKKFNKKLAEFKEYIDKHGVNDKLLHDLYAGFKNVSYPDFMLYRVAYYVCKTKSPKQIIKFLDFEGIDWVLGILTEGIIETGDAEYIKLFMQKYPKNRAYKEGYKNLKKAYKEIVKANKAGI